MKKQSTYIISLEGKDLIKANKKDENKGYITNDNLKLYRGALDYSLEALKISEINDNEFKYDNTDKKQRTKAVVNVTFKYAIKEKVKSKKGNEVERTIKSTKEIREDLYKKGFILDGCKYVRFKRSSGASRVGKCLFIKEKYYKDMMKWSYMGLNYTEKDEMDLASMEAYISLTTSSIIDTLELNPKNILLIDDFESEFEDTVMGTDLVDGSLKTKKTKKIVKNSIWDGQSMMDISAFGDKYKEKGFLLLRNRFFKSACFNANIQKWFKDNNITEIKQLNGITYANNIEDIKLITTPSSIKYLKVAKQHKRFKGKSKEDMFKYWVDNLGSTFGVVKYEKPPYNINRMVQTHYQLLNTLPLSKEEMRKLLTPTLKYIELLKNDITVLRNHIGINAKTLEERELKFDFLNTNDMIYNLLMINDKFANTKVFQNFKQNMIDSYRNNIRKGHVLVRGNYSVLCGNAIEMLKSSILNDEGKPVYKGDSIQGVDEVYCKDFKFGLDLLACRSPHVTMGNLWVCKNRRNKQIESYFNSSRYIIHVNSVKNNLLERLSSSDFDSDSVLLTDNEVLVDAGKRIYGDFLVPTDFSSKKSTNRTNSIEDKIDLDIKTSKNLIGEIINLSQILNSEYWDRIKKGKSVEGLYELISQLDVLSCIEIDRAKKESEVNSAQELKRIRTGDFINKGYIIRNKKKKEVAERPYFFKFIGEGKDYKFVKKETPMDYLEIIIDSEFPRATRGQEKINILDLVSCESSNIKKVNVRQVAKILEKIKELNCETNMIWNNPNLNNKEKFNYSKIKKEEVLKQINKMKVTKENIYNIIKQINNSYKSKTGELRKIGLLILSVLYATHTEAFIELFNVNTGEIGILEIIKLQDVVPDEYEVIELYDKKYKKIYQKRENIQKNKNEN